MSSDSILEEWVYLHMTYVNLALMIINFFDLILVVNNSTSVDLNIVFWHTLLLKSSLLLTNALWTQLNLNVFLLLFTELVDVLSVAHSQLLIEPHFFFL